MTDRKPKERRGRREGGEGRREGGGRKQGGRRGNWVDWSHALLDYVWAPEAHKEAIHTMTEDLLVIYDQFPKARYHFLVLPRVEIEGPSALTRDHLPILELLHNQATSLAIRYQLYPVNT